MISRNVFVAAIIWLLQGVAVVAAFACVVIFLNEQKVKSLSSERQWIVDEVIGKSISPAALSLELQRRPVFLLDTRMRVDFAKGHIAGAYNIPIRELAMRTAREVPRHGLVVVYCGSTESCEQTAVLSGRPTMCGIALDELRNHVRDGNTRVLIGLIPEFSQHGLMISSTQYPLRLASLNE